MDQVWGVMYPIIQNLWLGGGGLLIGGVHLEEKYHPPDVGAAAEMVWMQERNILVVLSLQSGHLLALLLLGCLLPKQNG